MVNDCYKALGIGSTMMLKVTESELFKNDDYIKKIGIGEDAINQTYADCDNFIYTYEQFTETLSNLEIGEKVVFWVGRVGFNASVKVVYTIDEEWASLDKSDEQAVLDYFGIDSFAYGYYTKAEYQKLGFFQSIGHSVGYSIRVGGMILKTLGQLLTGALGINAVGGTVTTIVTTTKIISYGFVYALEIAAMIGVNLAVFNLLPIPALDGSRIVFCFIEWMRGKPISRKVEGVIHGVGLILILGFAILVDVLQFV